MIRSTKPCASPGWWIANNFQKLLPRITPPPPVWFSHRRIYARNTGRRATEQIVHFDVQGVDEGQQVTILDAAPLNPAKPAAYPPQKATFPWRPVPQKRLAVFATNRGEAGGFATGRGKAGGINAADLVHIRPPGTVSGHRPEFHARRYAAGVTNQAPGHGGAKVDEEGETKVRR
jgi:hypothetical protein